ncbi:MAG: YebC/PmpR family DNA-binding transcriptional regulator [bacterium]
MSGHSKWAQIRRDKEKNDATKGRIFARLIREIMVSARLGGGDPMGNPRLRRAIEEAKNANMPSANIERAIKRGTGELPGVNYEEVIYEAYGPGGVALLIEVMTENRNRAISEIRHIITKNGGNMGEAGSVAWMFQRKGFILVPFDQVEEDRLLEVTLDAGAEDVKLDPPYFQVISSPDQLEVIKQALVDANIPVISAELANLPQSYVPVTGEQAKALLKLIDALEDHDDVQRVWANCDIPDELISSLQK